MNRLAQRLARLEHKRRDAQHAVLNRTLPLLTGEELLALIGPLDAWDDYTDSDVEAVIRGERPLPPAAAEYEPPSWVIRRLVELTTPEEQRLLGLEVSGGDDD